MAELERYADDARAYGLDLTLLGPNAVREALPWLGEKVAGASLSPTDGQANPRVVGAAYARLARRLGVIVREYTTVLGATAKGRGFEVEASGGLTVLSRFLINACSAWSNLVAAAFGEPTPLTPMTPNMLVTEPLPYFISRSIGVVGGDVYVRQIRRGNVIFTGGAGHFDAERALARPDSKQSIDGMQRALELVPGLADANVIRTWSGVDGETPDHIPVIGFSSTTSNLIHAFGFSGHGFQLGPVVGVILSELILEGRTESPIAPFSIARFAGRTGGEVKIQGDAAKYVLQLWAS
jgi:sarcosine oxidase subunit beta